MCECVCVHVCVCVCVCMSSVSVHLLLWVCTYCLQIRDGHNNFDFTTKLISQIFVRPRVTTLIRKLRKFQFKLLHGAIYTKEQLLKFGFVDDLCSFCSQSVETYSHLFWNCAKVQSLWQDTIESFDLLELRDAVWQDIHVGMTGNTPRIKCCNTVIFIIKYIIYRARSESTIPSMVAVQKIVK